MKNTPEIPVAPDDDLSDDDVKIVEALEVKQDRRSRSSIIKSAVEKYGPGSAIAEQERERRYERFRKDGRANYAAQKGAPVRRYRQGIDAPTPEQRKAEEAAAARERYAAQKGAPVRPYLDLSAMTPEEKAAHKREQNRLDQQRRRARIKNKRKT